MTPLRGLLVQRRNAEQWMLYSMICVSSAGAPLSKEELQWIVAQGQRNNRRDAITGLLLHKSGHFMHLLEGVRRKVEVKRQTIALDYRLRDFKTLLSEPISERQWSSIAMAFYDLDDMGDNGPPGYGPFMHVQLTDPLFRTAPDNARKLVMSFRDVRPCGSHD